MLRPQSRPYARIWALPASLPCTAHRTPPTKRHTVRALVSGPDQAADGLPHDAPRRRGDDPQVEADRAVRDPLEVVRELLRPGRLASHPRLREAGQAGADDEPLPVARDLLAELLEE